MPLRTIALFLFSLFITSTAVAQDFFLKDDSLVKKHYLDETIRKKNELIASVGNTHTRDYKKVYEEQFTEIGSLWKSGRPITAALANDYLQQLVKRIAQSNPELSGTDARVVFTRDWWPNAMSMGDGTIGINAGLVIYLHDEAELAFIVSHELAHYYLQHTSSSIKKYIDRINSADYQEELKRLSKARYGVNKQLDELSKKMLFSSRKHSRDNERAADAAAFRFMRNSGFDCGSIKTALTLLDTIDNKNLFQPVEPASTFSFPGFSFKKKWVEQESSIFSQLNENDSPLSSKEKDSLKTHPDCMKRIEMLENSITANDNGKKYLIDESLFAKLKKSFVIEIAEECFRQDMLDRNLYYSIQLMQQAETRQLGAYSVARNLNRMNELQKMHKLGLNKDTESKGNPADYNILLRFLDRVRVDELVKIAYNFCKQQEVELKNFPGF